MTLARYSGAGNTFLIADNREGVFAKESLLAALGNVDGLILAERSSTADASMRIFNRDGSEAEMCGNGLRCLIHFLRELGVHRQFYKIETVAGCHTGWFVHDEISVLFPSPSNLRLDVAAHLHFINTGVPHAVLFVEDLEKIDVEKQGKNLRFSPLFAPLGANVNFAVLKKDHSLAIRTYERGVEAETLACGTGATAVALIAHKLYQLPSPINIWVRSGERIQISFTPDWSEVSMMGAVKRMKEKST